MWFCRPVFTNTSHGRLLLAHILAGAGVANDAVKVSAITDGVGLESLLNPTSLRLRQVAKHLKYNGNPRCWPQLQPEFKLWVKTKQHHEDVFLTALLDCLEGPPANIWLWTWRDREQTSSPITFDEVLKQLEFPGSRLLDDHYHQNLVDEADHSGEKLSKAELKN